MKTQFANTIEKLKEESLRAVTVVNNDTGVGIVCNKTGEELATEYGSIENFFNGLFEKGIKALKITDKLKNGSTGGIPTYRKFGDEYVFEFAPATKVVEQPQTPQTPALNGGMNAGMNGTIFRDQHYPMILAELETAKSDVKRLTEENRKLETKILINDTLEGKSVARTEANARMLEQATPLLAALTEKFLAPQATQVPGLNGANLSEVKQNTIKLVSQLQDDVVDNIALVIGRLNDKTILDELIILADKAEKLYQ